MRVSRFAATLGVAVAVMLGGSGVAEAAVPAAATVAGSHPGGGWHRHHGGWHGGHEGRYHGHGGRHRGHEGRYHHHGWHHHDRDEWGRNHHDRHGR
ncbi:hypothetical protein GCM10010211_85600 [Streptomyces albospinus]|uniref:Uncharacterized protein n=1 Tax=Streptomyces albospinus TaxID=285515 RepID=A0ABQ2VQA5_9ACTN|nr:hypothetical protein GCM10010211_85600 [Streptomyces albospinus]